MMQVRGSLDHFDRSILRGWVTVVGDSPEKLLLDVVLGERVVARVRADVFRQDLKDAGFGDGCCAFEYQPPAGLSDEDLAALRVRFNSSAIYLDRGHATTGAAEIARRDALPSMASKFGGLWIDRSDWLERLAIMHRRGEISDELSDQIFRFVRDGYVVFRNAVPTALVDEINQELDRLWADPLPGMRIETFEPDRKFKVVPPNIEFREGTTKLLDLYAFSAAARTGIANISVMAFLAAIFEAKPKAFQSLNFWNGSQQAIHKDTAYVRVDGNPLALAATWLALEDVEEGTGELEYYVGSHRAPDFVFGQDSKWMATADQDYAAQHDEFLRSLHEDAKRLGHVRKSFLAGKGDVLVWHADLAHGGSPVTKPGRTRRSLVTHYCPVSQEPYYRRTTQYLALATERCEFVSQFVSMSDVG